MNRDEQLEAIRDACVKANPDKACPTIELKGDKCCEHSIRLADVLLAMEVKDPNNRYQVRTSGHIGTISPVSPMTHVYTRWNLPADDLTLQPDETINFLYALLQDTN